jgi:hypothetical protein
LAHIITPTQRHCIYCIVCSDNTGEPISHTTPFFFENIENSEFVCGFSSFEDGFIFMYQVSDEQLSQFHTKYVDMKTINEMMVKI